MPGTEDGSQSDDLLRRIQKARGEKKQSPGPSGGAGQGIGVAIRMATEFMVAVIAGGGIGWLLDSWLGTRPWLMIVFFILGVAAGFLNVFKAAAASAENHNDEG